MLLQTHPEYLYQKSYGADGLDEENADGNQTTCYHLSVQFAMQEKRHYGSGSGGKMAAAIT